MKTANLGKWFPPWTVTRVLWHAANASGISTDVVLQFTTRACADAWSAAKRGQDTRDSSAESLDRPRRPVSSATTCRASDDDPPARKSARAMTYASSDKSSPLGSPTSVPIAQYQAPPAQVLGPFPLSRRRPL